MKRGKLGFFFGLGYMHGYLDIYFWIILGLVFLLEFFHSGILQCAVKEFGKTIRCHIKHNNKEHSKKVQKKHKPRQ